MDIGTITRGLPSVRKDREKHLSEAVSAGNCIHRLRDDIVGRVRK